MVIPPKKIKLPDLFLPNIMRISHSAKDVNEYLSSLEMFPSESRFILNFL